MMKAILFLVGITNALDFMMNKAYHWYCFEFESDHDTEFTVDYSITGISVEDHVKFNAIQSGFSDIAIYGNRTMVETFISSAGKPVSFCWEKTDDAAKKVNVQFTRSEKHSSEKADK